MKLGLSTKILIGLGLGIGCGLFFGEGCAFFKTIGDGFIRLLQMTILPYIMVSLIYGIGSLNFDQAKRFAVRGGIILFFFSVLGIVLVWLSALALPPRVGGSFFSSNFVAPVENINYLEQYIPTNPFHSMANTIIPAVVLFCVFIGIALIGIKKKKHILEDIGLLTEALTRITNWVVELTPYGVFAIAANAAGTMTIAQVSSLQVYFIIYIIITLLSTFLVLPMIVVALTPFKYRDVIAVSWEALVTGFTTANLFVVMPIVAKGMKALYKKYNLQADELVSSSEVAIPIYFNLPDTGKLINLFFILFAAWFVGTPISFSDYPYFGLSGYLSFLGSVNLSLPYMLKEFHLSSDLFEIFIATGVITGRFSTLMATMDLFIFSILCGCAMTGLIKIKFRKIIIYGSITLLVFLTATIMMRVIFQKTVKKDSVAQDRLENMRIDSDMIKRVSKNMPSTVMSNISTKTGKSLLKDIKKRGYLRVGFNADNMPFAYVNKNGQLVGLDIAMAYRLAEDLNVGVKFIPVSYQKIVEFLNTKQIDIMMSSTAMSIDLLQLVDFSNSYMESDLALLVKDYLKDNFINIKELKELKHCTLYAVKISPFISAFKEAVPSMRVKIISKHIDFFRMARATDAMLIGAQEGSAWTLRHPNYGLAIPKPIIYKTYYAYPIAKNQLETLEFLNKWLELQKLNGFITAQYNYWILGKEVKNKKPRWSIIRNVLHWIGKDDDPSHKIDLNKQVEKKKKTDALLKKLPIVGQSE